MRRAAFSSGLTVEDFVSAAVMRVGRREVKRRMVLVNMVMVVVVVGVRGVRREGLKCEVWEE